jgi:flagellar biogenesis protein FliO
MTLRKTSAWREFQSCIQRVWQWFQHQRQTQQRNKRLRVSETVSLGEKRFLAVVQIDREQFLVGGSASSVSMLTRLENPTGFAEVLQQREEWNRHLQ